MTNINGVTRSDILKEIDDFIRFIFFPVGHGSCTLVSFPPEEPNGSRVYGVIDCNDASARPIRAYLSNPWFDGEIISEEAPFNLRFVMLTHYDEDHLLGIDHLLGKEGDFTFTHFLCPFPPPGAVAMRIADHPRKKQILSDIQMLAPEPSFLQIYQDCSGIYHPQNSLLGNIFKAISIAPSSKAIKGMKEWKNLKEITPPNILSSAVRFQWGDCSVIISGDVENDEWENIINDLASRHQVDLLSANIALCSHHGGRGNPNNLWQQISRCSYFHRQHQGTERRLCRTLIVVSCGSRREKSPSEDSLRTFFSTNSLVRCTSPAKACLKLHAGQRPSCIFNDAMVIEDEAVELVPGENPRHDDSFDLPTFISKSKKHHDFKKGSICVDIFPKESPKVSYHNGAQVAEITDICSCSAKLRGTS